MVGLVGLLDAIGLVSKVVRWLGVYASSVWGG